MGYKFSLEYVGFMKCVFGNWFVVLVFLVWLYFEIGYLKEVSKVK